MSHVVECDVVINDLDALKEACEDIGGTFHVGQKNYKWFGQYMGDYPMPEGMKRSDLGKCDHAMSFPGASYEVGVRVQPDGTARLAYDFWGGGGLSKALGGTKAEKLAQGYTAAKFKKQVRKKGYAVQTQVVMADGSIRVEVVKH